jgi:hypothetical protein
LAWKNNPPNSLVKCFSRKPRVLQWLDRRVGVPVCFLLTLAQVFETVSRIHRQRVTPQAGPAARPMIRSGFPSAP